MNDSIRNRVIWRLTNGRKLSDGEVRELDALQIALDLDDNDPLWGQVAWIWATAPRKTDFDTAAQAIIDRLKLLGEDLKDSATLNVAFSGDEPILKDIHKMLQDLKTSSESRGRNGPGSFTEDALKKALSSVVETFQARESHQQVDFVRQFRDAVREGVSWVWVALAGALVGLSLVFGYTAGESAQRHDDAFQVNSLKNLIRSMDSQEGHGNR